MLYLQKLGFVLFGLLFAYGSLFSQTQEESSAKPSEQKCISTKKCVPTANCIPINCRGEKTKFTEAKVITELRNELTSLLNNMGTIDNSTLAILDTDHQDLMGDNDLQSLEKLANLIFKLETKILTQDSSGEVNYENLENNAQKVKYLQERIGMIRTRVQ